MRFSNISGWPVLVFWEKKKKKAISLPSKQKHAKMQMLMYFDKEIQSLNANFVFKNWNGENIQLSNWKVGSYIHNLYLISSFDIFMLKFSTEIVFFPPAICPIYTQYTYTQIDALRVKLTVLVPDVTICVYTCAIYNIHSKYWFFFHFHY